MACSSFVQYWSDIWIIEMVLITYTITVQVHKIKMPFMSSQSGVSMIIRKIGYPNFRSGIRFKKSEYLDIRSGKFGSDIQSGFYSDPDQQILKTGYPDPIQCFIYNNKIINITLYLIIFMTYM